MTTNTTTDQPAAAAVAPVAQVEHLNPHEVVLEDNIRTGTVDLDDGFLDSLRTNGVLTPVTGRRGDDGTVHVRYGQRRVLGAREVGLATIPVYLAAAETTVAGRVVEQLVENERRAEMSDTERVDAYRVLQLEGLSVAKIAKATGTKKDTVAASLKIAASTTARAAIAEQASFDHALALAEFDGDEDACATILSYPAEDLPWVTQRLRDDRTRAQAWEQAAADATAAGWAVVDRGSYDYTNLSALTDAPAGADDRPALDPETHTSCPGHRVSIRVDVRDGAAHTTLTAVCVRADRHKSRWGQARGKVDIASLPEEEQDAAREKQRAERRRLIQNNKDWDAATTVRREWLTGLLSRKTLPKDAAAFIAITLTRHSYETDPGPTALAGELVGLTGYDIKTQLSALVEDHPAKAGHVNLAVVLAARENHTSRESWRTPNPTDIAYLLQLETWGYHLSPVEKIAAGYPEPDPDATQTGAAEPNPAPATA